MKIMLHGATDRASSNFGDFLYGNELYCLCRNLDEDTYVCYYNESPFFKQYTKGHDENKFSIKEADRLVYIPGGYFSEPHNSTLKRTLINFKRYMPFGLAGCRQRKRMAIVGLGAGNIHTPFLKWPLKRILKRAELITVRDELSEKALQEVSPKAQIENYGDMILSIDLPSLAQATAQTQAIKRKADEKNKKLFVVHYNHSVQALELFAEVLKKFKDTHTEYLFVVAADSIIADDEELYNRFEQTVGDRSVHYKYENPFELIELLRMADVVVTCKLHLGVVSCMLGKSVISVAEDYPKTSRFYGQIGQSNRCAPWNDCTADKLANMLDQFCEKPIAIPYELIEKSKKHRERLIQWLHG